jgi:hypothetical protein
MAGNLYPPPRPLSIGETIDLAFRIFRATLVTCLLYAGLAVIASELPTIYKIARHRPLVSVLDERDPSFWLLYAIGWLLWVALCSLIVLRQYAVLGGRAPASGAELGAVGRRLPGLLLLFLGFTLASGVWFIPAAAFRGFGIVSFVLALIVLAIPATWVAVMLSAAWPVFLLTGKGAVDSLGHSWRLVSGSWWRLAAIYTVGLILLLVLYFVAGVIAVIIAIPVARGDLTVAAPLTTVITVVLSAVGTPFLTALLLAVYGDLAVRREGADLAQRIAAAG